MTLEELSQQMNTRFDGVNADLNEVRSRVETIENSMPSNVRLMEMGQRFTGLEKKVAQMDGQLRRVPTREEMEKRFADVEERMVTKSDLKKLATKANLDTMYKKLDERLDTITLALDRDLSSNRQRIMRLEQEHGFRPYL